MTDLPAILTETDRHDLIEFESTIKIGLQTFYDVGTALAGIRDRRLYREQYDTFEDYCRERWEIASSRARQLIGAAEVMENVKSVTMVTLQNERQARPLTSLAPARQREAWQQAVETAPEGKVTGAHVQQVVDQFSPKGETVTAIPEIWLPFVTTAGEYHKRVNGEYIFQQMARTGFPEPCPLGPVHHCLRCDYYCELSSGARLCSHEVYQEAQGDHFCRFCGAELSLAIQAEGGAYCQGEHCDRAYADVEPAPEPPASDRPAEDQDWFLYRSHGGSEPETPVSYQPDYDGDEWYTTAEYVEAARAVMGEIDLDPASCAAAQEVVRAVLYYDKQDDGLHLQSEWSGRVWLNPPYSNPSPFTDRAIEMYQAGKIDQCIILVNNATETRWFQRLLASYPACFLDRRISFWHPGRSADGPRQAQVVFYLGQEWDRFVERFHSLGTIVEAVQ